MQRFRRNQGQSIVFMAILILVLIAFAGLSIDTGNAMASQRKIQAASNSSAVSGMNMVVRNDSDAAVQAAILQSLTDNGVAKYKQVYTNPPWNDADSETVYFRAIYLNSTGQQVLNDVGAQPNVLPLKSGVQFVYVITSVKVKNTFASAVGVPTYTVNANGIAGIVTCKQGVYPITFDKKYLSDDPTINYVAPKVARYPNASIDSFESTSRFRVTRKLAGFPGNFSWIRWNGDEQNGSAVNLESSLTYPGNLSSGFAERTPPTGSTNGPTPGEFEAGDWIAGDTGNVAKATDLLNYHMNNKTRMILPVYDTSYGQGGAPESGYHIVKFVTVRLLGYSLNGNDGYFDFGLIEDNSFCTGLKPEPQPSPIIVTGRFDEQLLWYKRNAGIKSYDLVIVQDYSASMAYKWDADVDAGGYPNRRIDSAIATVNTFVKEMLETRVTTYGAENRLAYVVFGPNNTAKKLVDFTTKPDDFKTHTGYGDPNFKFPKSTVGGNTPTAHGLASAVTLLNSARKVDSKGQEVKLAVLVITDGLSNVFYGGNRDGKSNTQKEFNCDPDGPAIPDTQYLSDPYWQANCPTAEMSANTKPPILSVIEIADAARSNKNIVFYAVVIGYQAGRTPEDLQMNKIAPGNYALAGNAAQLNNVIGSISQELFAECTDGISLTRSAAGATVTIREKASKAIVTTATLDNNGSFTKELPDGGSYTISASHLGVVAPADVEKKPRNYTILSQVGGSQLVPEIDFTMNGSSLDLSPSSPILITIDDPANAKCP